MKIDCILKLKFTDYYLICTQESSQKLNTADRKQICMKIYQFASGAYYISHKLILLQQAKFLASV